MILYLVRHSYAEPASQNKPDSKRALTVEGIEILKQSCQNWKEQITKIDCVVSSPLLRAVQTADVIKNEFNLAQNNLIDKTLLNGYETEDIISFVNSLNLDSIMLVGHQPDLSHHLINLINEMPAQFGFKPATIAGIQFKNKVKLKTGKLMWILSPDKSE